MRSQSWLHFYPRIYLEHRWSCIFITYIHTRINEELNIQIRPINDFIDLTSIHTCIGLEHWHRLFNHACRWILSLKLVYYPVLPAVGSLVWSNATITRPACRRLADMSCCWVVTRHEVDSSDINHCSHCIHNAYANHRSPLSGEKINHPYHCSCPKLFPVVHGRSLLEFQVQLYSPKRGGQNLPARAVLDAEKALGGVRCGASLGIILSWVSK